LAEEDDGEVVAGELDEVAEAEGLPVSRGHGSSVDEGAIGAEVAEGELDASGGEDEVFAGDLRAFEEDGAIGAAA